VLPSFQEVGSFPDLEVQMAQHVVAPVDFIMVMVEDHPCWMRTK
jgi:hypothetical protein